MSSEIDYKRYGEFSAHLQNAISNLRDAIFFADYLKEKSGFQLISDESLDRLKHFKIEMRDIENSSFDHFLKEVPVHKEEKPETEAA